jgi:outer membrane protein assembly factor BamA
MFVIRTLVRKRLLICGMAAVFCADAVAADLSVRGFGWLKNREMALTVRLLLGDEDGLGTVDASLIEDAALVLTSELVSEGFFDAQVRAVWTDTEGRPGEALLDAELSRPLPRPLVVTRLRLEAVPGKRAVVEEVLFEGLKTIPVKEARAYFRPETGLFTPERVKAWSEERSRRAATRLRDTLRSMGFNEAEVDVTDTRLDRGTGEAVLAVRVDEGPRWRVRAWRPEVTDGSEILGGEPAWLMEAPWTRSLAQDLAQATRSAYFSRGYADARVSWTAEPGELDAAGERAVTAVARVEPGEPWIIGEVRIEGAGRTQAGLMESRAKLQEGAPHDPEAIDAARLRLARLGVFRRVDAVGEPGEEPGERDVVFRVVEEPAWRASWTIGYGSYEQLRGAAEVTRGNLWGLAHRDRATVGQSMKASRAEYRYTVPTLFDDTVEGSARIFGLRREEPSFTRLEYGAGVELAREMPWIQARGTAGLSYEVLRAEDVVLSEVANLADDTVVTAINLGLTRDRRDSPIRPRAGQRWSLRSETAVPEFGSEVRYQRVEAAWSWHGSAGTDRWVHLGASHGFVIGGASDVPVNRLFFPGGESSIRGYPEGEASPRDANGRFIGARSVWLVNAELEQLITGNWTGVLFTDVLGQATDFDGWPGDEVLASVGLGIRYQSPIGPVRLEYGRNLNRRDGDPSGTVHFSIGFPF